MKKVEKRKEKILSEDEAAKNLLVTINNEAWEAKKIAIVRRHGKREHWVYMVVENPNDNTKTHEYFMERKTMIASWIALDVSGVKKIDDLQIEVDDQKWVPEDLFKVRDDKNRIWITLCMKNHETGTSQVISIERESIIAAFYALRFNVEDMVDSSVDAIDSFIDLVGQ